MRTLKNILSGILAFFITLLFIAFIPIIILVGWPIGYFKLRAIEKKYAKFLADSHGRNFFCYNNRKNSKDFIESNIIPSLPKGVELIYLEGYNVKANKERELISKMLYQLNLYKSFPHLVKIRHGKIIEKSINNPFYNTLNLNKPTPALLNQIREFFEQPE